MTFDDFKRINPRLVKWFRRNLDDDQVLLMFQSLENIPAGAYQKIVTETINNSKTFPTINEIWALYRYKWRDQYPESSTRRYDPNETDEQYLRRITVQHLWEAFKILKNNGHEQFLRFCTTNNFSNDDVDRVESKFRFSFPDLGTTKTIKGLNKADSVPF